MFCGSRLETLLVGVQAPYKLLLRYFEWNHRKQDSGLFVSFVSINETYLFMFEPEVEAGWFFFAVVLVVAFCLPLSVHSCGLEDWER